MVVHGQQDITISDNSDVSRYEVRIDGEVAGFCQYERRDDRLIFPHTEIGPAFEGRGIGGKLVAYALDDARARHLQIIPKCSFIASYIRSHPEYADVAQGG